MLREVGIVTSRADAQRRIYRLNEQALDEVEGWLGKVREFWNLRLDKLETKLLYIVRKIGYRRTPAGVFADGEKFCRNLNFKVIPSRMTNGDWIMNEYGELLDDSTVRFKRILPGPIERVWAYLTEGDKRAQWLCGGDVETTEAGHVDMHFHNMSLSTEDDIPRPVKYRDTPEKMSFIGTVTRCEPPVILAHTWEFGEELSEVCYELAEQGEKVLLVLTHRRLETPDTVLDVSGGWHTHLNLLVDVLNGRSLRPFYKMQAEYESAYRRRLGL